MATRTVTFTSYGVSGEPVEGDIYVFKLKSFGTYTDAPIYLRRGKSAPPTDENGESSIELWVNEDSEIESIYEVKMPSKERARFILPAGVTSIDLSDLIINYSPEVSPQIANSLVYKADRDAGNIGADYVESWREALGISGSSSIQIANTIFVSKSGDNSTGTRERLDLPFLTVNAAEAVATSGDEIYVFAGDYSSEDALGGVDGVTYTGASGALLPAFNVKTGITIYGSGKCLALSCNHADAVMDMPGMDSATYIECIGETQTAGNAGTYIYCDSGTQTINATSIGANLASGSTVRISGGNCTINCQNIINNVEDESVIQVESSFDGELTINGNLTLARPIASARTLGGSALTLGGEIITTNISGTKIGIFIDENATGTINLINCSIATLQSETEDSYSIYSEDEQTVNIIGSFNSNNPISSNVTLNDSNNFVKNKSHFIVSSADTITVSTDEDSPTNIADFEEEVSYGFSLRTTDGAVQNTSGRDLAGVSGNVAMQVQTTGGTKTLYMWSEVSSDGTTFTMVDGSLRQREVASSNESFLSTVSFTDAWPSGYWVRFAFASSGSGVTFEAPTLTSNSTTITGKSIVWELTEQ